jgi:hypothetical protein
MVSRRLSPLKVFKFSTAYKQPCSLVGLEGFPAIGISFLSGFDCGERVIRGRFGDFQLLIINQRLRLAVLSGTRGGIPRNTVGLLSLTDSRPRLFQGISSQFVGALHLPGLGSQEIHPSNSGDCEDCVKNQTGVVGPSPFFLCSGWRLVLGIALMIVGVGLASLGWYLLFVRHFVCFGLTMVGMIVVTITGLRLCFRI